MNVVLVTVDSLRADHVGFSDSQSTPETPAIDSIAADGFIFQNAFANAPYTRASFPAILTGTYPDMYGGYQQLSEERPYLASRFDDEGFATGGFHSNPYLSARFNYGRGFDRLFSGKETESVIAKLRKFLARNLHRESAAFSTLQWFRTRAEGLIGSELGTPYVPGDTLNEQAIGWLDDADSPVFLWVHYMDVHHPYIPHDDTASGGIERSRAVELREKMITQSETLTGTEAEQLRRLYRGEIQFVDRCIGELMDAVERNLEPSDTTTVFIADHGEAFGEHDYWGHPDELHDELLRIPFVVDIPDVGGERISTPVSTVDIFPTVMDINDYPIPERCVGDSVIPFVEGERDDEDRYVFAQASGTKAMVCDDRYKLIRYFESGDEELFDRKRDPAETVDRSDEEPSTHAELVGALDEQLEHIEASQDITVEEVEMSEDVERRLEQLGYK